MGCQVWHGMSWVCQQNLVWQPVASSIMLHPDFPDKTRVPRFFVLFDGHFCRSIMVYLHFQVTPILFWLGNLHPITITPLWNPHKSWCWP
jgi:hypothetical protein